MMVHYGAPPNFRTGRDSADILRRVRAAEALLHLRSLRRPEDPLFYFYDLALRGLDLSIPGLREVMR